MRIRAVVTILGIAAALAAGAAAAQQAATIARLSGLEGGVMVSQADSMVAAGNDQRVAAGTRVVTLAGGKVMIKYDTGCEVELKQNQRFTVRNGECAVLLTEVVSLGPAPTVAAAGVSTGMVLGIVGVAGLGYGAYELFRDKSVSPN